MNSGETPETNCVINAEFKSPVRSRGFPTDQHEDSYKWIFTLLLKWTIRTNWSAEQSEQRKHVMMFLWWVDEGEPAEWIWSVRVSQLGSFTRHEDQVSRSTFYGNKVTSKKQILWKIGQFIFHHFDSIFQQITQSVVLLVHWSIWSDWIKTSVFK